MNIRPFVAGLIGGLLSFSVQADRIFGDSVEDSRARGDHVWTLLQLAQSDATDGGDEWANYWNAWFAVSELYGNRLNRTERIPTQGLDMRNYRVYPRSQLLVGMAYGPNASGDIEYDGMQVEVVNARVGVVRPGEFNGGDIYFDVGLHALRAIVDDFDWLTLDLAFRYDIRISDRVSLIPHFSTVLAGPEEHPDDPDAYADGGLELAIRDRHWDARLGYTGRGLFDTDFDRFGVERDESVHRFDAGYSYRGGSAAVYAQFDAELHRWSEPDVLFNVDSNELRSEAGVAWRLVPGFDLLLAAGVVWLDYKLGATYLAPTGRAELVGTLGHLGRFTVGWRRLAEGAAWGNYRVVDRVASDTEIRLDRAIFDVEAGIDISTHAPFDPASLETSTRTAQLDINQLRREQLDVFFALRAEWWATDWLSLGAYYSYRETISDFLALQAGGVVMRLDPNTYSHRFGIMIALRP